MCVHQWIGTRTCRLSTWVEYVLFYSYPIKAMLTPTSLLHWKNEQQTIIILIYLFCRHFG